MEKSESFALIRATHLSRASGLPELLLPVTHCALTLPIWATQTSGRWAPPMSSVERLDEEVELPVPFTLSRVKRNH